MEQGADFAAEIELQSYIGVNFNLSNSLITAEMRKSWMSTVSYAFDCSVVNASTGTFTMSMGWESTSEIESGRYLYDIIATDLVTNTKIRVLEGTVHVTPGITRI